MIVRAAGIAVAATLLLGQAPDAWPQGAPPQAQNQTAAREREALFAALATAKTEPEAREIEDRIWQFWLRAPDEESQRLLDAAIQAQRRMDYAWALHHLAELIKRAPDYAEGWNQRATVLFLVGQYNASLEAIEETLKREPKHFGALAGKGLILTELGQDDRAQAALREALAIDPWLKERRLIKPVPERRI
jgi:tetratricopeptide (TPR) repeat protein